MEITIDRNTLYTTGALVALLILLGLAALGRSFSPVTEAGEARLMAWSDWQLAKAEQRFEAERKLLRSDVDALTLLLNETPDPVASQLLCERIGRHASTGEAALQTARDALLQAARDVTNWSAGAVARDMAIASVEAATALLK